jgi:heat-inducible transcriptional repressor
LDKKRLLFCLIQTYIQRLEPISSSGLKQSSSLDCSSATIRNYFKKLSDEGYLNQEHSSSGRTPTFVAYKDYWEDILSNDISSVNFDILKEEAIKLGVSVFIKKTIRNILVDVKVFDDTYMMLIFSNFIVTTKFNNSLYKFVDNMKGFYAEDILNIIVELGLKSLGDDISYNIHKGGIIILNKKEFLNVVFKYDLSEKLIDYFLEGEILNNVSSGVYFQDTNLLKSILPDGYIGICHDTKIESTNAKIFVFGALSKDYEYFYKRITQ